MVLGHSLRDNGTRRQLAVLVTLDTLQASAIDELNVRRQPACTTLPLLIALQRPFMTKLSLLTA